MDNPLKFTIEKDKLCVTGLLDKPIKVPSQMFPLTGTPILLNQSNTEPFPQNELTEKIRQVYNSVEPQIGTCYTNADKLVAALQAEGIKASTMVGWLFVGGTLPVHHCFTMIDTHILDFIIRPSLFHTSDYENLTEDIARDKLTNQILSMQKEQNDTKSIFGQADAITLYIASPCKPQAGLQIYKKLLKAFPKHPCYRNIVNNTNKTQQMLFKKQGMGN